MNIKISFILLALFVLQSCETGNGNKDADKLLSEEENIFPAFIHFPNTPFKTIEIGASTEKTIQTLAKEQIEQLSDIDAYYILFPSDSTKLILPKVEVINDFKVYLKSKRYLDNAPLFYNYLKKEASLIQGNTTFSIFTYRLNDFSFTLSYFKQKQYIRLQYTNYKQINKKT